MSTLLIESEQSWLRHLQVNAAPGFHWNWHHKKTSAGCIISGNFCAHFPDLESSLAKIQRSVDWDYGKGTRFPDGQDTHCQNWCLFGWSSASTRSISRSAKRKRGSGWTQNKAGQRARAGCKEEGEPAKTQTIDFVAGSCCVLRRWPWAGARSCNCSTWPCLKTGSGARGSKCVSVQRPG